MVFVICYAAAFAWIELRIWMEEYFDDAGWANVEVDGVCRGD